MGNTKYFAYPIDIHRPVWRALRTSVAVPRYTPHGTVKLRKRSPLEMETANRYARDRTTGRVDITGIMK